MSHDLRTASLATRVVLAVAFTLPAISYASAQQADPQSYLDQIYRPGVNDAFGSQQEDQVLRAARAAPDAQQLQKENARVASAVPMAAAGKRDLLGDGGHQDAIARQMFPLGTAANDW